jgi:hypothetical protein
MLLRYFGTLKIAMRFDPKFIVASNVPTKTFLVFALTNRQPLPLVIFSPRFPFLRLIVILVVFPATSPSKSFVLDMSSRL